jgi:hypothetical protein
MDDDREDANTAGAAGATRRKLARRQGGAARVGLDREEAAGTLRASKRAGGDVTRGRRAGARRNAGGRAGGDQVAHGGHTRGDRTGIRAALNRGGAATRGAGAGKTAGRVGNRGTNRTTLRTAGATTVAAGRGRDTARKPGERTRSGAHKAGKKK